MEAEKSQGEGEGEVSHVGACQKSSVLFWLFGWWVWVWTLASLFSLVQMESTEQRGRERCVCLLRSDFRLLLLQQTIPIYTFSFCKISTAYSPYALNAPVYSSADSITVSHLCPGVFTSTFFSSFPFFFFCISSQSSLTLLPT